MKFDIKNLRQVEKQLSKMQTALVTGEVGERVFLMKYRNAMVSQFSYMANQSREEMREILTTKTGEERKAGGGRYAGRDTTGAKSDGGKMVKSYKMDPKTGSYQSGGKYTFRVGFLNAPTYTIFQEYGTKSGIQGMNILMKDADYVKHDIIPQLKASGRSRFSFLRAVEGDIKVLRRNNLEANLNGLPEMD